jgi:argininosuccinate synthase
MKSRGVYETGRDALLAHRAVASLTMDREAMRLRDGLAVEYAALVYRGFWFSPEREASSLVDSVNEPVTAWRLRLYRSSATVGTARAAVALPHRHRHFEDDRGRMTSATPGIHPAERTAHPHDVDGGNKPR